MVSSSSLYERNGLLDKAMYDLVLKQPKDFFQEPLVIKTVIKLSNKAFVFCRLKKKYLHQI